MSKDPALHAITALRSISRNEEIKKYLLHNKPLYKTALKAAMRFIGGETIEDCFQTAKDIVKNGHTFTIDFMGESTRNEKMANEAAEEFSKVIEKIRQTSVHASISLDLSHIGMTVNNKLALKNAIRLAQKAKDAGIEMMISMEGTDRTDEILEIYLRLATDFNNVGITLQAYLYRTEKDLTTVLKKPGRIRLVKGAYEASPDKAMSLGVKTDSAYKKLIEKILLQKHLCSIATHDEKLIAHADTFIRKHKLNRNLVEFEMLHGVTPERLSQLHNKRYITRAYLPYGKEWYLYLCHRLAENPTNIYQALADAVGNTKSNIV